MGTKRIETLLDTYGDLQEKVRNLAAGYDAERASLMDRIDPAILDALQRLDAKRQATLGAVQAELATLADTIKRAVAPLGTSVKGIAMQAVYTPPRPLWDDGMLHGFAMAHPEILKARKTSEPSVSLRPIKATGGK